MHLIAYHLPFFVQKHGCLKKFTGQGVEKNNDDAKRIFFQKSNKWDTAKDNLYTKSRQWDLKQHEREKATYTKRKLEYWGNEIVKITKQKRSENGNLPLSEEEDMPGPAPRQDYNKLTIKRLKEIVKERGLSTKGLSKLKKRELISLIERGCT